MSVFMQRARATDLYRELCQADPRPAPDGFALSDDQSAEAQVEFLRWAVQLSHPHVVVEIGTGEGRLGFLLSLLMGDVELHTFGRWPGARRRADLLNQRQNKIRCLFYEGDTRETLPQLKVTAQLAWIDEEGPTGDVLSSLLHCYRLAIPFVGVQNTARPSVRQAVDYVLIHVPYEIVPNPFEEYGNRQAALLKLTQRPLPPRTD